jgi:hypothetical protein
MLKRFALNFILIFLFAFVQIGAATHQISHFGDFTRHNQQDQNKQDTQCEQCISFAKIAGGLQSQTFVFNLLATEFFPAVFHQNSDYSLTHTAYAARSPPYFI